MRHVLHIMTKKNDALARLVVEQQQDGAAKQTVEMIDLTQPNPDYNELVKKIFESDSIEVW